MREAGHCIQKIGELTMERDFLSDTGSVDCDDASGGSWSNGNAPLSIALAVRAAWRESVEPVLTNLSKPDGEQLALMRRIRRATSEASIFRQPHDDADTS